MARRYKWGELDEYDLAVEFTLYCWDFMRRNRKYLTRTRLALEKGKESH